MRRCEWCVRLNDRDHRRRELGRSRTTLSTWIHDLFCVFHVGFYCCLLLLRVMLFCSARALRLDVVQMCRSVHVCWHMICRTSFRAYVRSCALLAANVSPYKSQHRHAFGSLASVCVRVDTHSTDRGGYARGRVSGMCFCLKGAFARADALLVKPCV